MYNNEKSGVFDQMLYSVFDASMSALHRPTIGIEPICLTTILSLL